jgi:tetratricopeptide (TPR) repeat protein
MAEIRNVKLELLRPGPAHNQLLSPLTPYLALCGADGPVTVNIPFEHRHLLNRLERLSYSVDGAEIAASQREAEMREIGEAIGGVFAQVPALLTELGNARSELVHLRLSMTASELALVPFELAIASDGFPGSGSPLFLQSIAPITLTREVRRGQPLAVDWNRKPKILFAFASPRGLTPVPAQTHLEALRRAIEPWVKWRATPEQRINEVKSILTVLPNASLQQIRKACAESDFTHVHILAHGDKIGRDDDRRYGIALCADDNGVEKDMVDGDALATALTAKDSFGGTRFRPTLVSLATCDSGHQGSVITPGGSLAHALHAGGIPWVIASQFPLWMRASSIAVEVLYNGLLRGDDPRLVLYTLRQRLRTDSTHTHDWASIVAYAVAPWDFERQLEAFRNQQARGRIEVKFDRAEELIKIQNQVQPDAAQTSRGFMKLEELYDSIREDLQKWREESAKSSKAAQAERLGMSAASEKRIGNLYDHENIVAKERKDSKKNRKQADQARQAYASALKFYKEALQADPKNHWVVTQYLSLCAVLAAPKNYPDLYKQYGDWWMSARWLALQELRTTTGETKAWSLATLAELELLGSVYNASFDARKAQETIVLHCSDICAEVASDAFAVFSTRRQFTRYIDYWSRDQWIELAKAAVATLGASESWVGRPYLGGER